MRVRETDDLDVHQAGFTRVVHHRGFRHFGYTLGPDGPDGTVLLQAGLQLLEQRQLARRIDGRDYHVAAPRHLAQAQILDPRRQLVQKPLIVHAQNGDEHFRLDSQLVENTLRVPDLLGPLIGPRAEV